METLLQFCIDNSEIVTDWMIALSMAWGVFSITVFGVAAIVIVLSRS